jgi:uncharacterized protein YndB with AHSA1/START domain
MPGATMTDLGQYVERDGRPAVQFVRTYPHAIDRVWSAVTQSEELVKWFPSSVELEPTAGGTVTFSGDPYADNPTGTVLTYEPPHRVAFTWGADEVHLELEPVGDGACRVTLTNVLSEADAAARNGAGWAVCLAELDKHLAGQPSDGPHSADALPFAPLYDAHVAAGLPSGAEIPPPPPR